MQTATLLSLDQTKRKKAKELYESTFATASLATTGILFVATIIIMVLIHWLSLKFGFGNFTSFNLSILVVQFGPVGGRYWALRKVREAGLS